MKAATDSTLAGLSILQNSTICSKWLGKIAHLGSRRARLTHHSSKNSPQFITLSHLTLYTLFFVLRLNCNQLRREQCAQHLDQTDIVSKPTQITKYALVIILPMVVPTTKSHITLYSSLNRVFQTIEEHLSTNNRRRTT